jgi:hypothetical protein
MPKEAKTRRPGGRQSKNERKNGLIGSALSYMGQTSRSPRDVHVPPTRSGQPGTADLQVRAPGGRRERDGRSAVPTVVPPLLAR